MAGRCVFARLVVVTALVAALVLGGGSEAPAAPLGDTTTTTWPESDGIIPEPNSGVEPEDAGDRGGALQTAVFTAMLAGVGVIAWLAWRQSQRARQTRSG